MSRLSPIFFVYIAISIIAGCSPRPVVNYTESTTISDLEIVNIIGPDIGSDRNLSSPRDIAINQRGELFIADYGNDRIVKLDSNFIFVTESGGFGDIGNSLNGPLSLAIDNASNLYIVDSGNSRIVRLDGRLNFISGQNSFTRDTKIYFDRPLCIALSIRGDIYVGDNGAGECYKFDPFFNYVFNFGSRNSSSGIGRPAAIAVGSGNQIYVADSENGGISVFDDFGILIRRIIDKNLILPSALRIDSKGRLWVADNAARMLFCFNTSGKLLYKWPENNSAFLISPAGLCFGPDGLIYLLDSTANRILILKPIYGN
jgi:DNA-binding beta-propeller fold protein YncE